MSDGYTWWRDAVERGVRGEIHPNDPQPGYYRLRRNGQQASAVAYWIDTRTGEARCHINGTDVGATVALETWPFAAKEPVQYEAFRAFMETNLWPDMDEAAQQSLPTQRMGHNQPPTDPLAILKDQIDAAYAGIGDYAKIESDEASAKAQSLRARLLELNGEAEKKREAEKKPHLEAGRAVDRKWKPLTELAQAGADAIRKALRGWENEKDRRAELARRAQAAANPEPLPPAPPPPVAPIKGAYGRAASVRIVNVVTIVDQLKVYQAFRDNEAVRSLLQKLAQKAVDDGFTVEGVKVEKQKDVV